MEHGKLYKRIGDMSPSDHLVILMESDGDVILLVEETQMGEKYPTRCQVQFCTSFAGGGRSIHTRRALIELADAIEKDNKEWPIEEV